MKMFLGKTPINAMNVKHFEMDTNSCTAIPSDLQSGVTCVAKGKKITGTGKSFEFASYGNFYTNYAIPVPTSINVVEVACLNYPVQLAIQLANMKNIDFSTNQTIGNIVIEGTTCPLIAKVENNILMISCSETVAIEIFYGKDNYT